MSSLIGDSIILIATIKYKAIKLHKLVVTVMQHMAVCDLIQTVFSVSPSTLALISYRWVVGELLCNVQQHVGWICGLVTMLLTCVMTTLKLITVKYPLRTRAWSTRLGHKICCSVWLLVLGCYAPLLVMRLLYIRDTIHLKYYTCMYDIFSRSVPTWYIWYSLISLAVLSILSFPTLLVTSVLLLIVASRAASRHGETLRWEGVITVLLTVGVFFISYLPFSVWIVTASQGIKYSNTSIRVMYHLTNLNVMANFFVYSLTVRSFRHFLKVKIFELLSLMMLSMQGGRQLHQRHQRPVAHQLQRPYPRQRPNPRQDPPEVQGDDILTPAADLQGSQLQEDEIQQNFPDIVDTPV